MAKLITENLQEELRRAKEERAKPAQPTPEQRARKVRKRSFLTPVPVQMPYKPFDPVEAYKMTGIPYNLTIKEERDKIFEWCRFFSAKHHLVPTLIDVFVKFPIIGFSHSCKDKEVSQFFDEYAESIGLMDYIINLGTEYWTMGNAVSFGVWSDALKCWIDEDLVPIENVEVKVSPVTKSRQLFLKVTDEMYRLLYDSSEEGRIFKEELQQEMPEIIPYIQNKKAIPLDLDYAYHLKTGGDKDWRAYGEPIMLRIFDQLEQETKLNRALKAVSDRLYAPLIHATVGAPAGQLGDDEPWIPDEHEMNAIQETLENALLSDLRIFLTHFAVDIKSINLSGDRIPQLGGDFDRIEKNIFQAFGINPDIISGGSNTYASTAIAADFLIQRFTSYQNVIKNWLINHRYRKIAEANGFIAKKRGKPIKEKVIVRTLDEETGEYIEEVQERDKVLVPDIVMTNMDMRTDAAQRDFVMSLRNAGIPISDKYLIGFTRGQDIDFEIEMEQTMEEEVEKAVRKAQTNKAIKDALEKEDLTEYYEPIENINAPGTEVSLLSTEKIAPATNQKTRPEESDEQRKNAPQNPAPEVPIEKEPER